MSGASRMGGRCAAVTCAAAMMVAAALGSATVPALATPLVGFSAEPLPIARDPGTGDVYGAGASVRLTYTINGSEYEGSPPPLAGVEVSLPAGAVLDPVGFAVCPPRMLELGGLGPQGCPRETSAGGGEAHGFVTLGGERVRETSAVEPFYAPGGGIELFLSGYSPLSLEMLASGQLAQPGGGSGPELLTQFPLFKPVPGTAYASFDRLRFVLGTAALMSGGAPSPYLRMPAAGACPPAGLLWRTKVRFAAVAGLPAQTVAGEARSACPLRATQRASAPEPPPTPIPGTGGIVTAPPSTVCRSRRDFVIHVQQVPGLTYRTVTIRLDGRRVAVVHAGRFRSRIDLRGLPKGRYVVAITVLTTSGNVLHGIRAYHTCARHPLRGGHPSL